MDRLFQAREFPVEVLRALRIVPDAGLLQLARYLLETLLLEVVVKDTP
jgi:hypothetical protein